MLDFQTNKVWLETVIISTKEMRGDGKKNPFRYITQVFTHDGELIAEYDPITINKETQK